METDELKKIWNTLADKKLIDQSLAKESIMRIITKKGNGIINKMQGKAKFDYYLFLTVLILMPIFLLAGYLFIPSPFPNTHSFIGISAVELFFIYMFIGSIRNRKLLETSFNNESIKESIIILQTHLKAYLKKYYLISLISGYCFLFFALIQSIVKIGGVKNIFFDSEGFNLFASHLIIVLILLIIALPFMLKIETKIRFSGVRDNINKLLIEINEE